MSERGGFLNAIRQAPKADAPRLIYADWLDENGEGERAGLIRFMVAGGKVDLTPPRRQGLLSGGKGTAGLFEPNGPLTGEMAGGFFDEFRGHDAAVLDRLAPLTDSETLSAWGGLFRDGVSEAADVSAALEHPMIRAARAVSFVAASVEPYRALARSRGLAARQVRMPVPAEASRLAGPVETFPHLERLALLGDGPVNPFVLALLGSAPGLVSLGLAEGRWDGADAAIRAAGVRLPALRHLTIPKPGRDVGRHAALAEALGAGGLRSLGLPRVWAGWSPTFAAFAGVDRLGRLEVGTASGADLIHAARTAPGLKRLTVGVLLEPQGVFRSRECWPALEELRFSTTRPGGPSGPASGLVDGDLLPRLRGLTLAAPWDALSEDFPALLTRLCSGEPLALETLDLSGVALSPAERRSLAGVNAPLTRLTLAGPLRPETPAVVSALGRAGWARSVRALTLGGLGRNKAVWAAAVKAFGPRCDQYWLGNAPP